MILVGISGVTCSGKTTLLHSLSEHYGDDIEALSFDDYFIGSDFQNVDDIEDFETPQFYNFDAFYTDLKSLKSGEPIRIRANSRESVDSGVGQKELSPKSLVVVEGWLLYHEPRIAELFDGKIYIDISEELLAKRRYERTKGAKHWDSPEYIKDKIIPAFYQYVKPQKELADLVLNASDTKQKLLDDTVGFIDHNQF